MVKTQWVPLGSLEPLAATSELEGLAQASPCSLVLVLVNCGSAELVDAVRPKQSPKRLRPSNDSPRDHGKKHPTRDGIFPMFACKIVELQGKTLIC